MFYVRMKKKRDDNMANIMEYVTYYGDKTFDEIPFNDIDALIFTQFCYIELDNFLTPKTMPITIEKLSKSYFLKVRQEDMKHRPKFYRETYELFNSLKNTKRYKNIEIHNYQNIIDSEKQFGAMTFRNSKKWAYIAFEGTDTSIIGWKEDFNLSHQFPIPSQQVAINYLENEIKFLDKNIYVGGHSKGGNLSLVSVMKSSSFVRHRVKNIYSFDGPGLREREYHSLAYKRIQNKIKMFVPSESIVGMLLNHDLKYEVVKSSSKGLWQHDPFSWQCFGSVFVKDDLSKKSIIFSKSIKQFLEKMPDEERAQFIEAVFTLLDNAGIKNTESLTLSKILKCISGIGDLTEDKKIKDQLKSIFGIILDYLKN